MADAKLTGWFPPEIKPVREGIYQVQVRLAGKTKIDFILYSKFQKGRWMIAEAYIETAQNCNHISLKQEKTWRGLAQQPLPKNYGTTYYSCIRCLKEKTI